MTRTPNQRINALPPGQQLRLSGDSNILVTAKRSGNGYWLRFVRRTRNGLHAFKTARF